MKRYKVDRVSQIERNPELAFAEVEEVDLSDFHSYIILRIESGISYGRDQYGRYKTLDEENISIYLFEDEDERMDHMISLQDSRDDSFDFETIASGKLSNY